MSILPSAYATSYAELVNLYPAFYREIAEMQAILSAEGAQIDAIEAGLDQMIANRHIATADEATIAKLEVFIEHTENRSKSISERRNALQSHFMGTGKCSASMLERVISTYSDTTCKISFKKSADNTYRYIDCVIGGRDPDKPPVFLGDIDEILFAKLPAHLKYEVHFGCNAAIAFTAPRIRRYRHECAACGTLPDTATLGIIESAPTAAGRNVRATLFGSSNAGTENAGTLPYSSTIAACLTNAVESDTGTSSICVDNVMCGTEYAGMEV